MALFCQGSNITNHFCMRCEKKSQKSQKIPKNPKNPKSRTPFFEVIYPSVPMVMEPELRDCTLWTGVIGMYLRGKIYLLCISTRESMSCARCFRNWESFRAMFRAISVKYLMVAMMWIQLPSCGGENGNRIPTSNFSFS